LSVGRSVELLDEVATSKRNRQARFYQPELDGLRFYAFLAVFACHTLPPGDSFYRNMHFPWPGLWAAIARSGGAGVDLFFVLSAYLITTLLMREREETGGISVRFFYVRRILRIWPLYFAVFALGLALVHARFLQRVSWYYEQRLPWYYSLGYVLFLGNWSYAFFGAPQSICAPMWTVSVEEQFYLIWPPLMKLASKRGMAIAASIGFLLAIAIQASVVLFGVRRSFLTFNSASGSLPLGVLLALFADRLPQPSGGVRLLLVVSGLVGWVAASAMLYDDPVLSRLLSCLASGAIFYGCLHCRNLLVNGKRIVLLGKISYGLYMLHFSGLLIALTLFRPKHGFKLLAGEGVGFVVTVLLAAISYRWIESPFLRLKDRFATVLSRPV
jgi:peptidoglycan/LPS O-acetylase OafA/YrhL